MPIVGDASPFNEFYPKCSALAWVKSLKLPALRIKPSSLGELYAGQWKGAIGK